jgi:hypothetical protein
LSLTKRDRARLALAVVEAIASAAAAEAGDAGVAAAGANHGGEVVEIRLTIAVKRRIP